MLLSQIKGLKFPDEYVTKFFFKEGLHRQVGNVLELGCGNGNNLRLFYEFGWNTVGVDFGEDQIADANSYFETLKNSEKLANEFRFSCMDMVEFISPKLGRFDVLLLPSSMYYLNPMQIDAMFKRLKESKILKPNVAIFIRNRLLDDYRYARGVNIAKNSFELNTEETGEKGCINTFFSEYSLLSKIKEYFEFDEYVSLRVAYENIQNGMLVANSDIVFWTRLKV